MDFPCHVEQSRNISDCFQYSLTLSCHRYMRINRGDDLNQLRKTTGTAASIWFADPAVTSRPRRLITAGN
jgi:hypothetical protein